MANLLVGIVTGLSYIGLPMMVLADGQRNEACNCRHHSIFLTASGRIEGAAQQTSAIAMSTAKKCSYRQKKQTKCHS